MDSELDEFKRVIDMRQYAAAMGYTLDKHESWRGSAVMRCGGDKIVIKRDSDGHYVYFSVRDDRDHGTIIDFIQNRQGLALGEIRRELRRWLGRPEDAMPALAALEATPKDRMRVEAEYHRMRDAPRHPYLERGRRLPAELLASERFAGRIRIDGRGNAVFPHFDGQGLCGYELKNWHFTGFAAGGEKGLWLSHQRPDDNRLVCAESAIDALSYAALHPETSARYASIGGTPSPKQIVLIAAAVATMPPGSEIVSAMDCDRAGRGLSQIIGRAAAQPGGRSASFRVHSPDREGDDWNDVLKDRSAHSLPAAYRGSSFPKPPGF
jgi:DNA-binding transcriptional MerR regulator